MSRNTVKSRLKALVDQEDKRHPCSDEQLAKLLEAEGMAISRRTVAKYRMELGIGGAFSRREEQRNGRQASSWHLHLKVCSQRRS